MSNNLNQHREQIIALDQWERVCDYLEAMSQALADVRTEMPGQDSLEARKMMAAFIDDEVDKIRKTINTMSAKPTKIDDPG